MTDIVLNHARVRGCLHTHSLIEQEAKPISSNTHNLISQEDQAELKAKLEAREQEISQLRSQLEEAQAEANACLDSAVQWQSIAEHAHEQIDRLKTDTPDLEVTRDRYLARVVIWK